MYGYNCRLQSEGRHQAESPGPETAVSRHSHAGTSRWGRDLGCCISDRTRCWGLGWLHGYNKWCCVMRLTSQSAPLLSRILNCWDLSTTPQPRYTLRHDQNSNSILSRVDIVKIFIHCKNIRGCRVSCLLEHNWGAAACGLLPLLLRGDSNLFNSECCHWHCHQPGAASTLSSSYFTPAQEPSINNVINI